MMLAAFLSGMAGLILEVIWIKALGLWLGVSVPAVAAVLSAFMAGLGVGYAVAGSWVDRSRSPGRLYAWFQVGAAVSGACVSLLLLQGGGTLAGTAVLGRMSWFWAFAFAFIVLLVPTAFMGATLPALSRACSVAGRPGIGVGWVYAINTAGAVAGCLLPDAFLNPRLGLTKTAMSALCLQLPAAVLAWNASRAMAQGQGSARIPGMWPFLLAGLAGFCGLGLETVWSRLLQQLAHHVTITPAAMLAVYLACLAVGAAIAASKADEEPRPLAKAAVLMAFSGCSAFLALAALPGVIAWLGPQDTHLYRPGAWRCLARALQHSVYLEGMPCLAMGAAFPYLVAAAVPGRSVGRSSAGLYTINAMGGVLGPLAAGFLLLPVLGSQASVWVVCLLMACGAGLACAVSVGWKAWESRACLAIAGLLASGGLLPRGRLVPAFFPARPGPPEAVVEGPTTIAAVFTHRVFGLPYFLELAVPGDALISTTSFAMRRYMGLLSHLPLFFRDGAKDALLICYGVGNSARSLLSHPELERLDIAEISPEVASLSPFFSLEPGGDPMRDPRVRLFVEDGRRHLAASGLRYDVITSEPPPPNRPGVSSLYSREYFALARKALRPGGVLSHWLPVHHLTDDQTRSVLAAAASEFPHLALAYGYSTNWILLASDRPFNPDPARWARVMRQEAVSRDLSSFGVHGVPDLLGSILAVDGPLKTAAALALPVTDDRPSLGFLGPDILTPPGLPLFLVEDSTKWSVTLKALPLRRLTPPEYREILLGAALSPALPHPVARHMLGVGDDKVVLAEQAWKERKDPEAGLVLGRRAYFDRDFKRALAILDAMKPEAAGAPALYWLVKGRCQAGMDDSAGSASSLARAKEASASEAFRQALSAPQARKVGVRARRGP